MAGACSDPIHTGQPPVFPSARKPSFEVWCSIGGDEHPTGLGLRFGFGKALLHDLGKAPLLHALSAT